MPLNNLVTRNTGKITKDIREYIDEIQERTRARIKKANSFPIKQHMVPRFVLRQVASTDPSNIMKESNLLLREHKIEYDPITKQIGDFIPQKQLLSPTEYSVRKELYNSKSLEHEFFMETMFSIIEGDASRLLRSRILQEYNPSVDKPVDPFLFPTPELKDKPSKIRARTILSTFFSIQFLRPEHRKIALEELGLKQGVKDLDFAGQIMYFLKPTILQTYSRQWVWARVPNHEMFISELGLVTVSSCSGTRASLMPLSRRDFIYFHDSTETHFKFNDKLVTSTSSILYDWYYDSLLKQICDLELKELPNGNHEISFVSHQKASFSRTDFYKTRECCLSCVFRPMMKDDRDKLFLYSDIDLSKY